MGCGRGPRTLALADTPSRAQRIGGRPAAIRARLADGVHRDLRGRPRRPARRGRPSCSARSSRAAERLRRSTKRLRAADPRGRSERRREAQAETRPSAPAARRARSRAPGVVGERAQRRAVGGPADRLAPRHHPPGCCRPKPGTGRAATRDVERRDVETRRSAGRPACRGDADPVGAVEREDRVPSAVWSMPVVAGPATASPRPDEAGAAADRPPRDAQQVGAAMPPRPGPERLVIRARRG